MHELLSRHCHFAGQAEAGLRSLSYVGVVERLNMVSSLVMETCRGVCSVLSSCCSHTVLVTSHPLQL